MNDNRKRICGLGNGPTPRPASWCGVGMSFLICLTACAASPGRGAASALADHCPPGAHNYGDGMVAALLPKEVQEALGQAHAVASQQAGSVRSPYLADQPWQPHVSVIYGVTEDRADSACRALQDFVKTHPTHTSACLGQLRYWDDADRSKTTLVVDVVEPAGQLAALHDTLAQAAHISSRFAYHPHITLLYLQGQSRLSPQQQAAVFAPLQGLCWSDQAFYVTDPCGQSRFQTNIVPGGD